MPCVRRIVKESQNQFIIAIIEGCIFFASLIAARLHLQLSDGYGTDTTYFHFFHALFCLVYSVSTFVFYGAKKLGFPEICQCDPLNMMSAATVACFAYTCFFFLRYWKRALNPSYSRTEDFIRALLYTGCSLAYMGPYIRGIFLKPCDEANFYEKYGQNVGYVVFIGVAVIMIDSSLLAILATRMWLSAPAGKMFRGTLYVIGFW